MMDRTALRAAVVAAYQQATPQAQRLIEDAADGLTTRGPAEAAASQSGLAVRRKKRSRAH
jgi:hypothetical protein